MRDLADKVVLVTGSGKGLGRAIALAFGAHKCRLALCGRNLPTLENAAEEARALGAEAIAVTCDVTRREQVEFLEREIERQFGPVQILVNNAGMAVAAAFLKMDDRLWDEVLRVNLTGTYYCSKVFLPSMVAAGWGRIINIASTVAKVAYSHIAAYATSKHAVLGLTRALAVEFAKSGVTVNAICPGYIDTELTHENAGTMAQKTGRSAEDVLKSFKATSPQDRLIAPEEVAQLAVLLACESARGITGQAINVDGGAVMA